MAEEVKPKEAINDTHRKIAFAFIKMMQEVAIDDADALEVATQCISTTFGIDAAGVGGAHDEDVSLVTLWSKHVQDAKVEDDEKFKAFIELLEKKGYFKGVEPGSEEHQSRMGKARAKFISNNNPYQGLTPDQLKQKGNELMQQSKYKEAIGFYTKAIEGDPTNHIYYANRAAAHTHLKDYSRAIMDCEKAISIDEKYSKAWSRLGTAHFYSNSYQRATTAFNKAVELDPENEGYKADLKAAQEKASVAAPAGGAGGMGGMPGFPGMPPGMDMSRMMEMMNSPAFMNMAQGFMQNPEFANMVQNFAGNMGMQQPNQAELDQFLKMRQDGVQPEADADGNITTPFGRVNKQALERLQKEEVEGNPKFQAIMEDVKVNGMGAFQKYMGDPEVMKLMQKFMTGVMQGGGPQA
jgi:small glutamine-rich tetratricopeptide repeat-containing protein alpha